MRLKIIPSKSYVVGVLTERAADISNLLAEDETKLAKLNTPGLLVGLYDEDNLKRNIQISKNARKEVESQLAALKATDAPKVLLEFDI